MKITIKNRRDGVIRVFAKDKFVGIIKQKDGQFLCYSKGRHTTTDSMKEVIMFFNGHYDSYYYRGKERE